MRIIYLCSFWSLPTICLALGKLAGDCAEIPPPELGVPCTLLVNASGGVVLLHVGMQLDPVLELLLGRGHRLLFSDDHDTLLVGVLGSGEDDPGPGLVPDLLDVAAGVSHEELVVLRLGLHGDAGQLLLVRQLGQQLDGLLHVELLQCCKIQ